MVYSNRIRACINVLGDAYGAAIIEHLSRYELAKLPHVTEDQESTPEVYYQEAQKGSVNGSVAIEQSTTRL